VFLLEYSYDIVILGTRDGQSCGRHSLAGRKEGARKNSADQGSLLLGRRARRTWEGLAGNSGVKAGVLWVFKFAVIRACGGPSSEHDLEARVVAFISCNHVG